MQSSAQNLFISNEAADHDLWFNNIYMSNNTLNALFDLPPVYPIKMISH